MSKKDKKELAKRILKARLRYLNRHTRFMPIATILLLSSLLILTVLKWLIVVPYINRLLMLAEAGRETEIAEELRKMPILVRYSPIIITLSMFLMTISIGLIAITFHRVFKINYMSFLDYARLFLFFSTIMCSLSVILWANLGTAFLSNDTERIERLIGPIWYSEKMLILGFVAGSVALSIAYYQLGKISSIIYGTNRNIYLVFTLLNILSVFDMVIALPFYLYICLLRRREIFSIAYLDIAKYVLEE